MKKNENDKQYSFVALNPSQTNPTVAEVILDTVEPTDFEIVYYDQLSTQKKYSTSLQKNLWRICCWSKRQIYVLPITIRVSHSLTNL